MQRGLAVMTLVSVVLCLTSACWSQDTNKQADKVIEDCQKSVKAANSDFEAQQQKAETQWNDELSKMESQRDKTVTAAREDAIKKFVTIIDKQAEASDSEGVLKTWSRMAEVDPDYRISSGIVGKKTKDILVIAKVFDEKGTSVEAILQEYREGTSQAQQKHDQDVKAFEAELNRSREGAKNKALPLLVKIAEERAKTGDAKGSIAAWKAVLEVDPEHVQALRVLSAAGVLPDNALSVHGNRRSGKQIPGTIYVIGNHTYSLCVNGRLIITGDSSSVKSGPFKFAIGDLITVSLRFKAGRSGDYHGFKMFFQANDKKVRFFTNTREWYQYSPSDLTKWYEVKPDSQHPQAVVAFDQQVKMPIADGTGTASIWGESSKSGSAEPYLYHVVSEADLTP